MNKKRELEFESPEMEAGYVTMKALLAGASFEDAYAKGNAVRIANGLAPVVLKGEDNERNQDHGTAKR